MRLINLISTYIAQIITSDYLMLYFQRIWENVSISWNLIESYTFWDIILFQI